MAVEVSLWQIRCHGVFSSRSAPGLRSPALSSAFPASYFVLFRTAAHQASGGGSNTLTVNVDFPTVNPVGNPAFYAIKPVQYGVYVFDSTQGSDTDADWTFGTNPNIAQLGQSSSTLGESSALRSRGEAAASTPAAEPAAVTPPP